MLRPLRLRQALRRQKLLIRCFGRGVGGFSCTHAPHQLGSFVRDLVCLKRLVPGLALLAGLLQPLQLRHQVRASAQLLRGVRGRSLVPVRHLLLLLLGLGLEVCPELGRLGLRRLPLGHVCLELLPEKPHACLGHLQLPRELLRTLGRAARRFRRARGRHAARLELLLEEGHLLLKLHRVRIAVQPRRPQGLSLLLEEAFQAPRVRLQLLHLLVVPHPGWRGLGAQRRPGAPGLGFRGDIQLPREFLRTMGRAARRFRRARGRHAARLELLLEEGHLLLKLHRVRIAVQPRRPQGLSLLLGEALQVPRVRLQLLTLLAAPHLGW